MRRAAAALAIVLGALLAGCSEPEPTPVERARCLDAAMKEAEARRRAREAARLSRPVVGEEGGGISAPGGAGVGLGAGGQPPASAGAAKRALLERYGPYLSPFQRSALLSASISTYAEGEEMCRKWIEENRRFDEGRRQ